MFYVASIGQALYFIATLPSSTPCPADRHIDRNANSGHLLSAEPIECPVTDGSNGVGDGHIRQVAIPKRPVADGCDRIGRAVDGGSGGNHEVADDFTLIAGDGDGSAISVKCVVQAIGLDAIGGCG